MKRIRIGNDINISLRVLTAGEGRPLEGRNLRLVLRDPKGGELDVDFSIVGNTVAFVYPGRKQRHIGRYSVELWENDGEPRQAVADVNGAFELVRWSDEQGGNDTAELQTETLELVVELDDALACLAALFTGDEVSDSRDEDKLVISRGNTAYTTTVAALQSAIKARLTAAETGIESNATALSALPVKHLGVFDNMQQGYNAAAADGVCDDDGLALIFFTTAESIRNNCLIIQSVNRYHHITTQTMLLEGTSAKSWTRRIVLGGNKSVGEWQQLGGMVNTFHLSGTKLCGSLPSGTEVQLVDLAPIIPESTGGGGGFELDFSTGVSRIRLGRLGEHPVMRAYKTAQKWSSGFVPGYGDETPPLPLLGALNVKDNPLFVNLLSISGSYEVMTADGKRIRPLRVFGTHESPDDDEAAWIAWIDRGGYTYSFPALFARNNAVKDVFITIDYIDLYNN